MLSIVQINQYPYNDAFIPLRFMMTTILQNLTQSVCMQESA